MKKAFTLVELLAIIAMLGIIMAVTIPNVYSIISGSKKQSFEKIVKTIEDKSDLYVSNNRETVIASINAKGFFEITLQTLVDEGLLKESISDPRTGEDIPLTKKVIIKMSNQVLSSCYEDNTCYSNANYLTLKLTAASASANGATGTYASKNDSNYFIGANPNNWIEFGQISSGDTTPLMWRIIKNDDEGIKIIYEGVKNGVNPPTANGVAFTAVWDTTNSNKWNRPASLKESLTNWYNDLYVVNKESYVKPIKWCIGAIGNTINFPTDQIPTSNFLQYECIDGSYTGGFFNGKTTGTSPIGLIKASDYISTSSATTCTGSYQTSDNNEGSDCGIMPDTTITNFLKKTYWWPTMNAYAQNVTGLMHIRAEGGVSTTNANGANANIRPVINLSSNVSYISGDGSIANPYRIGLTSGPITDTTVPVITMLGGSSVTVPLNSNYVDAGATATDDIDGDITDKMTIISSVNPNEAGTYTVAYNVSDRMGNAATQITREVIVFAYTYAYDYTGNYQTFTAPITGNYKIELWGAQGGIISGSTYNKGGYTVGTINLTANTNLYLYVGGAGSFNAIDETPNLGGYNGGGNGGASGVNTSYTYYYGASGGGATDVRANKKYRYIRDYLGGNSVNSSDHWVEIQAFDLGGTNVALNKTVTGSVAETAGYPYTRITDGSTATATYAQAGTAGLQYVEVDLGQEYTIDEIKVWHYYADSRSYNNTKTILYSADRLSTLSVYDAASNGTYTETSAGVSYEIGLRNRVMVAGGGGGAASFGSNPATLGGWAGGLTGQKGTGIYYSTYSRDYTAYGGNGGTQTATTFGIGAVGANSGALPSSCHGHSGGGGGYYGGLGGQATGSDCFVIGGGGGSSFISGYPGSNAINSLGLHTSNVVHYSGYTFSNSILKSGNESMPNPRGSGNITGNGGNGYAKITYLP